MSGRHVLVTGGTGFLGSALVRALLLDGDRVRVLDNQSRGNSRRLADVMDDIELVEADIRDQAAVSRTVAGVDIVAHLAAINGTEFFYTKPELVLDVAVRGMLNVVDACRLHRVRELIVASSSEAYQTPPVVPTPEDVPLVVPDVRNPRYSYGGGKIASELIAMNYGRNGFDRMVLFRPHNVYGPDMGWEHVLPQFIIRALGAIAACPMGPVPFPIQGGGSQTRAFIHIDDFTAGLCTVIDRGAHLGVYNIGRPVEESIAEVARNVFLCLGREPLIQEGPVPPGGTHRRCPDINKLAGLGFNPTTPLSVGLPSMIDWYQRNSHLNPQRANT